MVYFIFIFITFIFSLLEFLNFKKINSGNIHFPERNAFISFDGIVYFYLAFYLILLGALRYKTGRDWSGYMPFFDICLTDETGGGWEKGFVFINNFFKSTFNSFYFMQFCITFFAGTVIYSNIYKTSKFPIFTIFMYFVSFYLQTDMAQTRQFIAMAIIILGFRFIKQKKIISWILICLLSMQFHITALFAIPLYWTTERKISLGVALFLFVMALYLEFFGLQLILLVFSIVLKMGFIPARIGTLIQAYIISSDYGKMVEFGSGLGFLIKVFFYCLMLFFCYINKENKSKENFLLNFLIGFIFSAIGRNFDVLGRIANYFLICGNGLVAYNLIADKTAFYKKADILRLFQAIIFVLFFVLSFMSTFNSPAVGYRRDYLPYKTFIMRENY